MNYLSSSAVADKRVLVRVDFNVPMDGATIVDTTRIDVCLPTLIKLREDGNRVLVVTHLGRPKGQRVEALGLAPIASALSEKLGEKVHYEQSMTLSDVQRAMEEHPLVLMENIRFLPEEKQNDASFAEELAGLVDVYVNEAFSVSHREHASIVAVPRFVKETYAGIYFESEMKDISAIIHSKQHPMTMVLGGIKIDTKMGALRKLLVPSDNYLIGGGLGNTFLAAQGFEVGLSVAEHERLEQVRHMMLEMEFDEDELFLPEDVIVADSSDSLMHADIEPEAVTGDMYILDIGAATIEKFKKVIAISKTIIWNGPMGKFESPEYKRGTLEIAKAIAANKEAVTLVGGGDTIDALNQLGLGFDEFTHVSTAGGALLEYMEHETLPGINALSS